MSDTRDYNAEAKDVPGHRYAYGFDFDVIHPYMVRAFAPYFQKGSLLELGSFRGDFTQRLIDHFEDITCVEASSEAIEAARRRLGGRVKWVEGLIETVSLPARYENIVLVHVLEHTEDPVAVLRRVGHEWLSDRGRLFLACPNAYAPSRQIAVKMGLVSAPTAVTAAEAAHGHRRTYCMETLAADVEAAGMRITLRSGVFFKALANFQWDKLLQTDIVSGEYLEGCYLLGEEYPELCASLFLLCERAG